MAHEIRGRLDPTDAPTDKQTRFEDWAASFPTVADDPEYTEHAARKDGTVPAYDEFTARFDVREDRQTILNALDDAFPDVSWFVVHTRHAAVEDDALRDDPQYFDPTMTTGLRTSPTVERTGMHTAEVSAFEYRINGENYATTGEEIPLDEPDEPTTVTLYADEDGTVSTTGAVEVTTLDVHPGKIVDIETNTFSTPHEDFGVPETVRGEPPAYLENESESFPDHVPSEHVDRTYISDESVRAILNARSNNQTQKQIDRILDILGVVELE